MSANSVERDAVRRDRERQPSVAEHARRPGHLFVALVSATSGALVALLTVAGLFLWTIDA